MTTKKKNTGLSVRNPFSVSVEGSAHNAIAGLIAAGGAQNFVETASTAIRGGDLTWEDVDMLELFCATIDEKVRVRADLGALGQRVINTSMFPIIAGELTSELLSRDLEEQETIWQDLVTVRETNRETTHLIRIVNEDDHKATIGGRVRDVETHGYPTMSTGEDRVQVDTVHDGRRLAISARMLELNDKPGFLEQVNSLRNWATNRRDIVTIYRVFDVYGSAATPAGPYVYRPDGTGTALYTTSGTALKRAPSGTRIENNALVDGQSLQTAIDRAATFLNENGHKAGTGNMFDLVVPHALLVTADQLTLSERVPGEFNTINVYGPQGRYRFRVHSTPKIDDFTTTDWLLGKDIKRQFRLVSRINMEYVSMPASMQDFLRTRLGFEARVADEFEVGAQDHNRVVQCLSSDTPPSPPTLGS